MDFTLSTYRLLLDSLISKGYSFYTVEQFLQVSDSLNQSRNRLCVIRHDVDKLPYNSLLTAKIESSLGISGTYYFRIVPEIYNIDIMKEIENLGHEIGYHYEDVDLAARKLKARENGLTRQELIDEAYCSFCKNLEIFRKDFIIKTICMHGSPLAKFDNRIIWEKYNYKNLELTGESYFDIDWNKAAYFTDTGRKWNGDNVSVRDKVNSTYNFNFKTTYNIINNLNKLPDQMMITIHPQRWNDNVLYWTKELIGQSGKNIIKRYFYVKNKRKNFEILQS